MNVYSLTTEICSLAASPGHVMTRRNTSVLSSVSGVCD